MADLLPLVKGYLTAEGYSASQTGRDLVVGTRKGIGEATDFIYVWVPEIKDGASFTSLERPYLNTFGAVDDRQPSAQKFLLVASTEGLSREFREGASRWHSVKIRVPVQFFDTSFGWEESEEAASTARRLRDQGERSIRDRVPQPYKGADGQGGDDLLDTLQREVQRPTDGKSIHLIVGPAGIGKSHLFESLFARLHSTFMEDKRRQRTAWMRPLPLLPGYLYSSTAPTLQALLDAFLQTEFARPLTRPTFEWMMANGFAAWLLDGLDEVIARDPGFFDYLLDLLTAPGSRSSPTVLICVRDSLMATNEALQEFCDDCGDIVTVYNLERWKTASKRTFASKRLGEDASEFLRVLRSQPTVNDLASIPYYASLLVDQFSEGRLKAVSSESELVGDALSAIIQRDYDKRFIDKDEISEEGVIDFAQEIAQEDMKGGFQGVRVEVARGWAREWAELLWESASLADRRERFVAQMAQLGLFAQGGFPGHIRFAQELLEQYLLGQWYVRLFDRNRDVFVRNLGVWQFPAGWLTLRVVAEHIARAGRFSELLPLVYQAMGNQVSFRNVVQLASLSTGKPDALQGVPLERKDLSSVVFENLDFEGASFQECDLTNAEFRSCKLKNVDLTNAILKGTAFSLPSREDMQGAELGDESTVFSIRVDRGRLLSNGAARTWLRVRSGLPEKETAEPCPAALQLRHIFGKFVYPNGKARRDRLNGTAILRGKTYHSPEKTLSGAVRYGYLGERDFRDRYQRPTGDRYSELVVYMTRLKLAPNIRSLLDDVCDRSGCVHVPKAS